MGILDDAIREHLELKRQHGVADSELKQLEDEAFGPPDRPGSEGSDTAAEAPTEFMTAPEAGEDDAATAEPTSRDERATSVADLQEPPPAPADEEPADEEEPAAEAPSPETPSPETEERQAIAEQPTQHFDVEEEFAAAAKSAPSDEDLVEREMEEPRLAPVDPLPEPEPEPEPADQPAEDEEDEDFWDERRLSEELDQALEAPVTEPRDQPAAAEESQRQEAAAEEPAKEDEREGEPKAPESRSESDLLEDTPDFLEDAPEDDQLWFEQKPPKDFDFDD